MQTIETIVLSPENKSKTATTLFYDSLRKGLISCGRSTFFKYARLFGYVKLRKPKDKDRPKGFRATRPFEWLHVDVTYITTVASGIQYVAFVKDNFSRALLGFKSTPNKPDSNFIRDLFIQTFREHNLTDFPDTINILSDGGPENKGSLIEWINEFQTSPIVRKITAKTEAFPYSNSMSESTHSIYKTEFMRRGFSYDEAEHTKDLERFVSYYNNERYPCDHYGLTVLEVLSGEIPDKHRFKDQIQEARILRVKKNRAAAICQTGCFS